MLRNWEEFDSTLREIALIDLDVEECDRIRDKEILEARMRHDEKTKPLLAKRAELAGELEAYYKAHRREVEKTGKRSVELRFGRAGMRKGNPRLALMKGWKWEKVLVAIKERWGRTALFQHLVKVRESVNKDGLKAKLGEEELASIGVRIKQSDEFFFETFPDKVKRSAA